MVPIVGLWRAHELATSGALKLSFNGEMLLSYASDGQAVVRLLSAWGAASAAASATASEPLPDDTARSVPYEYQNTGIQEYRNTDAVSLVFYSVLVLKMSGFKTLVRGDGSN